MSSILVPAGFVPVLNFQSLPSSCPLFLKPVFGSFLWRVVAGLVAGAKEKVIEPSERNGSSFCGASRRHRSRRSSRLKRRDPALPAFRPLLAQSAPLLAAPRPDRMCRTFSILNATECLRPAARPGFFPNASSMRSSENRLVKKNVSHVGSQHQKSRGWGHPKVQETVAPICGEPEIRLSDFLNAIS
jgi:hypothetical protein